VTTGSVGTELLNEIERVSAKRESWKAYAQRPGIAVSCAPVIAMMTRAIGRAKEAVQSDDPAEVIRALEDLRGFDAENGYARRRI
jgi:hypothetical protein